MLWKPSESCDELCNIFPFEAIPGSSSSSSSSSGSSSSKSLFKLG